MIPKDCKRLAEVDFPIAVVSKHAAREKSIRHGHPSTLHLWWARRPLAACRAMLLGLLLPDPCDPLCPTEFKAKAARILLDVPGWNNQKRQEQVKSDKGLQGALLDFIGEVANWDVANNPDWIGAARALVKAAHPDETPLVVDPFAGGGSIPLEALRLGCEAFASDLNPVACLILKIMLEDIPGETHRRGAESAENKSLCSPCLCGESLSLAEELRRVGKEIKEKAEKELGEFYPKDPDGATPIAYLWARTVKCESPNCGAEIPLVRSFWLCKKANRKRALRYKIHHRGTKSPEKKTRCPLCLRGEFPHVEFEIFEPKSEKDVPPGTVTRAKATCLCCGAVLPPERVRAQLAEQRGGADVIFHRRDAEGAEENLDINGSSLRAPRLCGESVARTGGARMLAVVTLRPGEQGRHYRLPTERDYEAVRRAQERLKAILDEWDRGGRQGLCPVPDEPLPRERQKGSSGFRVLLYGMKTFGDLFTARQKVALVTLVRLTAETQRTQRENEMSGAVRAAMAVVVNRCADYWSTLCSWHLTGEKVNHTYGRQALPMIWDYCEAYPFSDSSGNYDGALEWGAMVTEAWPGSRPGQVHQADATEHPLPDETAQVWFTDPPYYDAVAYADLSDFFFVWLKRALPGHPLLHDPFDPANPLTPKVAEAIQDPARSVAGTVKDRKFYENAMARTFAEGRRVLREDGVASVVFAHKTTEGWEALLSGMIRGGWTITGSWPIATEMGSRLNARETASLATSVHLVCRPRPQDAPVGDWGEVLRELPRRVGDWMERLQGEGIRGADLVFACIGPALEIFSRYRKVETADGREVKLPEFLEKVWEVVGRTALEQVLGTAEAKARNGAAGAVEEDARLTALFLWTLQSTNGEEIHHRDTESTEEEEPDENEEDENSVSSVSRWCKGFSLPFDVVRRFAQPLGIDLPKWEGRIIETKKGVVRLMAVSERAKQLFGDDGADAVADWIMEDPQKNLQQVLFPELEEGSPQRRRGRRGKKKVFWDEESLRTLRLSGESSGPTTLDRVHAAMLLQAGGQANALRELIKAEQQRGPDFLRLANALSALYPKESEEKRLLDAMLLAVPR
jgi:adenine-specific DNA methylase